MSSRLVELESTEELINRIIPACALATILICISMSAHSEVYEWIDRNGQRQFSDQPPQDDTESNSRTYEIHNIDESLPPPIVIDTEKAEKKKVYAAAKNKYLDKECKNARDYLFIIQGRVGFTDSDGKEVYVSEKERVKLVSDLSAKIEKHCGRGAN